MKADILKGLAVSVILFWQLDRDDIGALGGRLEFSICLPKVLELRRGVEEALEGSLVGLFEILLFEVIAIGR